MWRSRHRSDELPALLAELGAASTASYGRSGDTHGITHTAVFQFLAAWRELTRHNIEAPVDASASQALVARTIETTAAAQTEPIVAATEYLPPLTASTPRDAYCA